MFAVYFRGLDALSKKVKASTVDLPIESVSLSLQDLIGYFHPPDEHLEHEDKQNRLRALKNRQNLFQEEVSFHQHSFPLCCCLRKTAALGGDSLTRFAFWVGWAGKQWHKGTGPWRNPAIIFVSLSASANLKQWNSSLPWQRHFILLSAQPSALIIHCTAVRFLFVTDTQYLTVSEWTQALKSWRVFRLVSRFSRLLGGAWSPGSLVLRERNCPGEVRPPVERQSSSLSAWTERMHFLLLHGLSFRVWFYFTHLPVKKEFTCHIL